MPTKQEQSLIEPWQAKSYTPFPADGGTTPEVCPECQKSAWIELGGADSPEAYHPNIDIRAMPGVDIVMDLGKEKLPFHDGHARRIKSIHSLNHLNAENGKALLQESFRVLNKTGVLYIMVTDLEFIMKRILEDGTFDGWMNGLYGTRGNTYDADYHYWGYTPKSLELLLREIGFKDVRFVGRYNMWEFRMEARKTDIAGG